ncbi:paired amphipathic helix containing protein [Reticulomyxa filosa]|uniref:Paired amphipathic helix containing protein n=1 Tax=Reticulomyxa filosa TaxID=46433 RepID=X6NFG1_RETFI|nr:paired amphipathic helix containing protein [Reticulomyxa filosa]|eukprot:ETO24474.1 paired amphipathic helix containing protein [Reticulomyxa filosa]
MLNHWYVSKPVGHEGSERQVDGVQFKNQYKDQFHRNEDDMFELDLMIETNRSAQHKLELFLQSCTSLPHSSHENDPQNTNTQEATQKFDLPQVEKRCITRLFGSSGKKVWSLLQKSPLHVIPIILKRLYEKEKEWENLRSEMKPTWQTEAATYYYKAHDYCFTVFKSFEEKRLLPKS